MHLSTQASVANSIAVKEYQRLGVERIVLARELSLDQLGSTITATKEAGIPVEFECFVHGAMCVAVSGRCLTSQFLTGRSANRGDCLQPCRRSYTVTDQHNGNDLVLDRHTVLSARDLCTIDIIGRLTDTGLHAFKIEGRMRDALYVKTTVECYRKARDAVIDGVYDSSLVKSLEQRLARVFNRGFSRGFYLKPPDLDIAGEEGNIATVEKQYAGRVDNYYPKACAADILLEARGLSVGDTVLITGPTTGAVEFVAGSMRSADNESIDHSSSGALIGLKTPELVREGDKVYVLIARE
ncbi:U32 family peptidase [Candidatus Latescibacterota bacterium]